MTTAEKTPKAKKAAPAAKAPKATKAAAAEKETASDSRPGRQPKPETVEMLGKLTKLAARKNGVTNIDAAAELGVTTLKASVLGRRLADQGVLNMVKDDNGRVTYQKA